MFDINSLAGAISGEIVQRGNTETAHGIATDSRVIPSGHLFVALRGTNFNGHRFADHALRKGAAGVIVENLDWFDSEKELLDDKWVIRVENTYRALADMASWWRRECGWTLIAVTGSCGKTTTKEMIHDILSTQLRCGRSAGNFNNEIGLPMSILSFPQDLDVVVVEMGMNNPGEIRNLSRIARPDIGVVTSVAPVHLQNLGTVDDIRKAKSEILEGISRGGAFVWDMDDPFANIIGAQAVSGFSLLGKPVASGWSYFRFFPELASDPRVEPITPAEAKADPASPQTVLRAENIALNYDGSLEYNLRSGDKQKGDCPGLKVTIPSFGSANVVNSCIALAVSAGMGISLEQGVEALRGFSNVGARMRRLSHSSGARIVDDSYNSNPVSMSMALRDLLMLPCNGRRIVVMGDMLELGEKSLEFHSRIVSYMIDSEIDFIAGVGPLTGEAMSTANGAEGRAMSFDSAKDAAQYLNTMISGDDLLLVKGSRGMHLENFISSLTLAESVESAWIR
ncbi:MAG: hypothetical protein CVV64_09260 [Candidatus Wallbacteria bacterium HGW-Wallbacteria-1]|jgi:UDP-N-acetylmuramoyl-tripeptide--D-alanyl-D-alanine ligase|uniref:UDP-N-acetylmuramoyl-tripeptide--D-alanyl-D-alanine ligase n=1 Tax=Candidatus Wallbacteria bacterium HGW-Wallbacteria-1 TaxID=2013854 RepID=A0A2N1PQC4_9BACT|nr:MAG: hypothetical protein CVV64_09260 [Candidatus Wallbacteria bacterium HGW-Wallbacteria-1]